MIRYTNEYEKNVATTNYKRGYAEGFKDGREEERRSMSALRDQLVSEGKGDVFLRAVSDQEYCDELMAFYFPNGIPAQDEAQ